MLFALLLSLLLAPLTTPGQQPQLAAHGSRVFLAAAHENRVLIRSSTDAGRTFRDATPIAPSGRVAAGMRRGPRIAVTGGAVLVAVIAGAQGGGRDGDVLLYRSTDEGATWSPGVAINDVAGAAREGLHAMASTPDGHVTIAWLDLGAGGTRIMAADSRDHGVTWSADRLVYASPDGAVCECCHPSIAMHDSDVAVMFRNHLGGARDLYVARATGSGAFGEPRKQGTGTWPLQACPMDGGAVGLTPAGIVSTWRRMDGIFLSTPQLPERQVGVGRDPVLALVPGGGFDLAWTAHDGILLQRGTATRLLGPGRFASMVAFEAHTLLAWEQQGQVVTQVVPR